MILPTIIRFVTKSTLALFCCAALVLSPFYRVMLVLGNPHLNAGWPFATASRLDGLAAGICVALLVRSEKCWTFLRRRGAMMRSSVVVLLCAFAVMTYRTPSWVSMALYGFSAIAALYAGLLLMVICDPRSLVSAFLRMPVFRYFGRISYAIYIFHQGIRGILDRLIPFWSGMNAFRALAVVTLSLTVTIVLAELSWRLIESKLIRRAHVRFAY